MQEPDIQEQYYYNLNYTEQKLFRLFLLENLRMYYNYHSHNVLHNNQVLYFQRLKILHQLLFLSQYYNFQ